MRRNPNLKLSYTQTAYSDEQIQELKKCILSPAYFIEKCIKIKTTTGQQSFKLRDYQHEMLGNFMKNRYNIILAARQVGKTETAAAYLLWYALFHEEQTILIASDKESHALEIMGKIQYAYEYIPDWIKLGIQDDNWNKHTAAFENKSRIITTTTSPTSGRSMTISLLYCDEFAFVKPNIVTEFWNSIQPTLATGGSCIITSTPNGDSNLFANIWRRAEHDNSPFKPQRIMWDQVPERGEEFKQEQIAILGHRRWLQEYECRFLSADKTLIDPLYIEQLELQRKIPKHFVNNEYPLYVPIKTSSTYLIGVDPSEGTGNDASVIELFSFPDLEQVLEIRSQIDTPLELYNKFKSLINFLGTNIEELYFSVENNSIGQAFINLYMADEHPPENATFVSEPNKNNRFGFNTNGGNRPKYMNMLKQMCESGSLKLNSPEIFKELKSFINKNGKYQAQTGATDDSIFATIIIIRIVEQLAAFDENAYFKINEVKRIQTEQWAVTDDPNKNAGISDDPLSDMPMPFLIG